MTVRVSDTGTPPAGTLLYVEDDVANARLMQRLLRARPGVRLVVGPDGATGLALARSENPDLILLDLHLPDMAGAEVLLRLAADPALSRIPVIILSADADVERLLDRGAAACLTKPFAIPDLMRLVDRFIPPHSSGIP